MTAPKLYLISIQDDVVEGVRTYRDLDLIRQDIQQQDKENDTHILHCGFVRPELSSEIELPDMLKGKVLYSGALRWALPQSFKSGSQSIAIVSINQMEVPCFLALNQWGYEIEDHEDEILDKTGGKHTMPLQETNAKETIILAAQAVLEDVRNNPLNREEIYALIIENGYYVFNTPTPVHVLDVQLNRFTMGTNYSKAAETPVFGKTSEGKYFLLGGEFGSPSGWISTLAKEEPDLYPRISELGVHDEDSYLAIRSELPTNLQYTVDRKRFDILLPTVSLHDPSCLLSIAPKWLLDQEVSDLDLSVRAQNVLLGEDISKIEELAEKPLVWLMSRPNMGRLSISDICSAIIKKIKENPPDSSIFHEEESNSSVTNDANPHFETISKQPLIAHLTGTIDGLSEVDRLVLRGRLGASGKVQTLEQIAEKLDVTRERVRQRQKKYVEKIISNEYWDDIIGDRIGQLLIDREEPLILEMLDIEDDWFKGFDDNYVYLGQTIQMFSENEIRVIDAGGRNVITRVTQNDWDALVKELRPQLKQKASEKTWKRSDINHFFATYLSEFSAQELASVLHEVYAEYLQYENDTAEALLVGYGKSADSAVEAVLSQAECPLHFTEIAKRASELLGKTVDERRAHGAVNKKDVWLFDRGTYGLIDHCPIPESRRKNIRRIVEHMLYQGPINKQWHSKNILEELVNKYPALPEDLDPYVLRMCLEGSDKLLFLNRMVWARSDSGMKVGDRIETTNSFIQILEEEGRPLSGQELKRRLSEIRDVSDDMQIHGNDRLVAVGSNLWGLVEWS